MSGNYIYFELYNGFKIPGVGLGTWQSPRGEVGNAVKVALQNGYKHIDCAAIYRNEDEIGTVFAEAFDPEKGYLKREDIFITSKLWNTHHRRENVKKAIEKTLKDLQLSYLDLYLVHWPVSFQYDENLGIPKDPQTGKVLLDDVPIEETWAAMEELVAEGKVKSIGVSNFNIKKLQHLLSFAKIKPAVNQVELHPLLKQDDLLAFCKQNGIHVTAYSPFASGRGDVKLIEMPKVVEVAMKLNKQPGQVLLRWGLQRGTSVIPKSVTPSRVIDNLKVFDFELSEEDINELNNLKGGQQQRFIDPKDDFGTDAFADN